MSDRDQKGRQAKGERHGAAKLSAGDVKDIRVDKRSQLELATAYGVAPSLIHAILTRKIWRHL